MLAVDSDRDTGGALTPEAEEDEDGPTAEVTSLVKTKAGNIQADMTPTAKEDESNVDDRVFICMGKSATDSD